MQSVIDRYGVIIDDWVHYDRSSFPGAAQHVLVSAEDLARSPLYFEHAGFALGLDLDPDDGIDDIVAWLPRLSLLRLNFTSFADGRAFSQARLLRERFAYQGIVRAHGEVLRDQLDFMYRCGISQFSLAEGEDVDLALAAFADISVSYQPELQQQSMDRVVNG